ncbi:MAG: hypothetical protein QOK07_2613 [Gemmatimonadaceae bacterium]|nr:hypothetical protein [Gemmatimonadaceae bacterium]
MAAVAAVVVNPAAAADPPEVVEADKVEADRAAAARAAVVVIAAVAVAAKVVVDKAVADRAVAVVDVPLVVEADKVVVDKVAEGEAVAQVVAAAETPVVAEDREAVAVVVDVPAVAGAAETANSLSSAGRRVYAAPRFFIDALLHRDTFVAAVDRAATRHVLPAAPLALAR